MFSRERVVQVGLHADAQVQSLVAPAIEVARSAISPLDNVAAVLALVCRGLKTIARDAAPIGPETSVRQIRPLLRREHPRPAAEAFSSLVEKAFGAIEAQLACLLIEHEFALDSKISAISIN